VKFKFNVAGLKETSFLDCSADKCVLVTEGFPLSATCRKAKCRRLAGRLLKFKLGQHAGWDNFTVPFTYKGLVL